MNDNGKTRRDKGRQGNTKKGKLKRTSRKKGKIENLENIESLEHEKYIDLWHLQDIFPDVFVGLLWMYNAISAIIFHFSWKMQSHVSDSISDQGVVAHTRG